MFKCKKTASVLAALAMVVSVSAACVSPASASEIPKEANVVGMASVSVEEALTQEDLTLFNEQLQEQQESGIIPYNTVVGDAGSSWITLRYISSLKSQAAFGCSCTKTMVGLSYALAYAGAGGGTHSGVAAPLSKDWSGEYVKDHTASGFCTVTLTASAFTTDMALVYTLMPVGSAYIV